MPIDTALDTNVVVYFFGSDAAKAATSERLLRAGAVVSVQVLNEVTLVARRKMHLAWPDVHRLLTGLRAKCAVAPVTLEVHELGISYAERHLLNVYDAMIVASAVLAGCATLYSEDMHDGLAVDGLTIRNPYSPAR